MPEKSGLPPRASTDNFLQYAREAMELAELTKSLALREELLKLAMTWLTRAAERMN